MTVEKITSPISEFQLINKTNEIINKKQDLLTAGSGITISVGTSTRSMASIVTVGSNRWQGVAYGNGVFVAVGNDGYTAYSSDGSTWSTPTQVGTNAWYSITFANNKFVAVGNNGYTTTTTDGITWTTPVQVSGLSSRLQSVRYGNGIFLAVGGDGKATTSTDGVTWTTPVAFGISQGNAIFFNGNDFIILGWTGANVLLVSTNDGTTFTSLSTVQDLTPSSAINFGNGVYVISGVNGDVSYSTDLINWSASTQILNTVESIYYDGTQFIAVGRRQITSTTYKYSTITSLDGITWDEPVDIGESASLSIIQYGFLSITYGGGKFVAVGDSGATTTFTLEGLIISATGGGGTPTDVQINGTSITSNNVANIVTNTAYNPSSNKIATMSDVPSTTYMCTTNTNQDITGEKTFVGEKRIKFKQSTSTNKLGFTLYDNSNNEKGYLEFNPTNKIDNAPLMTLGNYATSSSNITQVGFRRYSSVSGANGAYNLLTPLIADAKSPFNLTTTYTNFYMPLGFKNGSTQVLTAKTGVADLSTLFPTIATSVSSSSTDAEVVSAKCVYDLVGDIETLLSEV